MEDYRSLRCDLGAEDRARLDAHLARLDDIEKRLGLGAGAGAKACAAPTVAAGIDPTKWDDLPKIVPAQADLVAMMFACDLTRVVGFQLQEASDGGGGSVLDSTAILYSAEVGNPWAHDRRGMPWTIVGTGGGYFKSGRALKFSATDKDAHNRLLVHFLNMMGSPARTFGLSPYGDAGPLEGLTVQALHPPAVPAAGSSTPCDTPTVTWSRR